MPLFASPDLLSAGGALAMAPSIVGSNTLFFSSSGLTIYSIAHTVPPGANCLAVCLGVCKASGQYNLSDVSWNGAALGALGNAVGWTWQRGGSASWVGAIASPAIGTHNISVTLDVAPDNLALYAVNLANVDVTAMAAASGGAGSFFVNIAALSQELDVPVPSLIFGGMAVAQPAGEASFTPVDGVTELAEGIASGLAASRHFFGYRRETVAGSFAFGASCTQSSSCALAAVALKGV